MFTAAALVCLLGVALGENTLETVVPALAYGGGCQSSIELRNTGQQTLAIKAEAHRPDGTLASFPEMPGELAPGRTIQLSPRIEDVTTGAWILLRERLPAGARAALAVHGTSSCTEGVLLHTVSREAAYPMKNPWFDADTVDMADASILVINTSRLPATVRACYSAGAEYSLPGETLHPVCTANTEETVPPFGSRSFTVNREGSTHLSLRTRGEAVVLQMTRPIAGTTRMFAVDSAIRFGGAEGKD